MCPPIFLFRPFAFSTCQMWRFIRLLGLVPDVKLIRQRLVPGSTEFRPCDFEDGIARKQCRHLCDWSRTWGTAHLQLAFAFDCEIKFTSVSVVLYPSALVIAVRWQPVSKSCAVAIEAIHLKVRALGPSAKFAQRSSTYCRNKSFSNLAVAATLGSSARCGRAHRI